MAVIKQSLPDLPAAATVALADERREHVASRAAVQESRAAVQSCSPESNTWTNCVLRVNSYRLLSKNESVCIQSESLRVTYIEVSGRAVSTSVDVELVG